MAYQVLARKYRPERFQDVIGQHHVTQTLLNAFAQDRISHAYLFAGPRGVGKTTTARVLAKALNCLKNDDGNPCNECQNCQEITSSRSMDVLEIDGASNRGIDEIRNLRELVKYPPIHAKFKVFIIDEVHMLTPQAFNALLKTLEEPPPHVKFIFATTEPQKVLPTILSRCQRHDFHRMSADDIMSGLDLVIQKEGVALDDRTRHVIIRMADGSMRDALSLLDQLIAFCGEKVDFEQASSLLGIIPTSLFFDVTGAIRRKDRKKLLELLQNAHAQGYALTEFVSGLNHHFLNLLVCKADAGHELLEMTEELRERYAEESRNWDGKDLLRCMDLTTQIETKLKIVQQPRIYVETMMLKLAEMDSTVSVSDLISRISGGGFLASGNEARTISPQQTLFEEPLSKKPQAPSQMAIRESESLAEPERKKKAEEKIPETTEQPSEGEELLAKLREQWEEIIARMTENGTSLSTFLSHGTPHELKGKKLIVSFPRKYKFQIGMLKKNARRIESTVKKVIGESLRIDFLIVHDESIGESSESTETHPVEQRMLELFGGKIVK